MRVDAIVAAGCGAAYVGTASWALFGESIAPPFDLMVGIKDALIAGICLSWAMAEHRGGDQRARGIALVVGLIILIDAFLALAGGVGPWRTDISPNGSLVGSLIVGVGLVAAGFALVWFVRRPDTVSP